MVETRAFDIQNYLKTPEERAAYIEVLLEEGDPIVVNRDIVAGQFSEAAE